MPSTDLRDLAVHAETSTRAVDGQLGVYVLGMHRSGTSATTRVLNLLGLPVCDEADFIRGVTGNEKGHWESASLVRFNDALLRHRGAAWWCPPRPGLTWSDDGSFDVHRDLGRHVFDSVHSAGNWVWKDPRNCLTFPFWVRALAARPAVVLVLRSPLEIAASLKARNGFYSELSLGLWERYLLNLVPQLAGLPVLVSTYDDLLRDPRRWCTSAVDFLLPLGGVSRAAVDLNAVTQFLDRSLRHHIDPVAGDESVPKLSPGQRELNRMLSSLVGAHDRFAPPRLPIETPSTDRMLSQIRAKHGLLSRPGELFKAFRSQAASAPTRSKKPRRPAVSVVVIHRNEGAVLRNTIASLRKGLPPTAELIVVDDNSTDGGPHSIGLNDEVRLIRSRKQLGVGGARNLGAEHAKGAALVFSDAHVLARPGWYAALSAALERPDVGAAGPVLTPLQHRRLRVCGMTFTDAALNVRWLQARGGQSYPVPMLPGCFLAIRRETFESVGRFDPGMVGYGAEDLELCLRLWRLGFECVGVPGAEVAHRFRMHTAAELDWESFIHNLLLTATLHLSQARLTELIRTLAGQVGFPPAAARVVRSEAMRRRQEIADRSVYDDTWFFARFGIRAFSDLASHGVGAK